MMHVLESMLRRLRRGVSRSEWAVRIFRLGRSRATSHGLVMVQIDGLSRAQLERALAAGEMPFLRSLREKQHYRLHTLYSGLPSSTPAVQGDLFYGVKCAVPAFGFIRGDDGRVMRMFDRPAAAEVEAELAPRGRALLAGGSAYSNIYTGGADEPHFCAGATGWGSRSPREGRLALALLLLANLFSFVRLAALMVVEFFLAIADCVVGLVRGQDLVKEIKFIPTRVAICILLRELITIGAKIDVARGLPIVHLNLLGYDEQAHRRGPSSRFAHWALKGIDDAISRIARAAQRSSRRDYDLWVYADHGQEHTLSFPSATGTTIGDAVSKVFRETFEHGNDEAHGESEGVQLHRVRLLGGRRLQRLFPGLQAVAGRRPPAPATVVAMGPVGMVYAATPLADDSRERVARGLVEAGVPLVAAVDAPGRLRLWSASGEHALPDDAVAIFGAGHPFLDCVADDLVRLCEHPDAGDLVILGWRLGAKPMSFPEENGSHAGPGPEETRAFTLLPDDTPLPKRDRAYLTPADLREAALAVRDDEQAPIAAQAPRRASTPTLRIMTYNVHACLGMDGKLSPERVARVIAQYGPDIVALQELDVGRARTGHVDQAQTIARHLCMDSHFHATVRVEEELYGDAILTPLPLRVVKRDRLPGLPGKPHLEPRGALWVAIEHGGRELQLINTHLGLRPAERLAQAEALAGPDWLGHPDCVEPVILCGDFNATPRSTVCRRFSSSLDDAQDQLSSHRPKCTWFGRYPTARIDHMFVDPGIEVVAVDVPATDLARIASDHLPLIVDVRV